MTTYDYAELVTEKPVKRFLQKFCLSDEHFESLVIVSPWIGTLEGVRFTLAYVLDLVGRRQIPTYIITRRPEESWHQQAVDMLLGCNWVELRYNNSLHAKLYVCRQRKHPDHSGARRPGVGKVGEEGGGARGVRWLQPLLERSLRTTMRRDPKFN